MKTFKNFIRLAAFFGVLAWLTTAGFAKNPAAAETLSGGWFLKSRWMTEQGLPQNTVNSIVQTRDGYLWLGTFGGLARFDGVKFTVYNTANTPALVGNRIMSLYEDADGILWIGTETGDIINYRDGAFTVFALGDGKPNNFVNAFQADRAGNLWVGKRHGLIRYESKQADRAGFFPFEGSSLSITEDPAGNLWFKNEAGLARWQNGEFVKFPLDKNLIINNVNHLKSDSKGNLWTITKEGFGHFFDGKFQLDFAKKPDADRYLMSLTTDRENRAWFGFYENLYQIGADGAVQKYDIGEMTSGGIRAMFFDREDNLWLGTNGGGLVRLRRKQIETFSVADGLPSDETNVVIEDPNGGVWIGSFELSYRNGADLRNYSQKDGLPAPRVTALCFARDGGLWIGTFGGLARLKDGRITAYTGNQSENLAVKAIFEDRRGRLWLGRLGGGLQLFQNGEFTTYRTENGLVSNDVRFITEDGAGALWIGTVGGLSRFADGKFTNYTTADGLSNNFVRDVYEDADGTLWIGTYGGGLNRFRDGRFTAVTSKNGLFDDFVSRILTDERDNFWILGNRGIFSVSRRSLNDFADGQTSGVFSTSFGVADGMLSSEGNGGNQPAGWRMRDGRFWFPTIRGMAIINPKGENSFTPPVFIEEARLERETLDIRRPAEIQPGQENLEIHYTGLNFGKPEQVRFRYKLEGLDKDWTEAGTRRVAYFPHLPPGNYRFTVIAANSDSAWSEAATLEIRVLAPFWQRGWFIALAVVFVFGLLALSYQFRLDHLERRRAAQEELSRRLINAHESERQRIAAELHDGLGQSLLVIKNRSLLGELSANGAEEARDQFQNISEAATQAIEEVRQITYNLRPVHLNRLGLTQALEAMIETVAASTTIKFESQIALLDDALAKDSEVIFYRIVQECVNNIVKHSAATAAKIEISRGERDISVKISDDGQGFVPPEENAVSKWTKGGFGLVGMAERVRMLGGRHTIESALACGTTVTVKIDLSEK